MCGIAGVRGLNGEPVDSATVRKMIRMLDHRGPDDSGVYSDEHIALGHTRLSIIDLDRGCQPMHNEDKSIWITFNGEIFNYVELRADLVRRGHRFETHSDTEVILHLYEEQGESCVHSFNGQWAFAIWDLNRRKLFMSRDRLGIRPLFYVRRPETFVFASEIKAILQHPAVERELDLEALDQVFTFWCTLPPRTMFKGIQELPPGHSLVLQDGKLTVSPYWQLDYSTRRERATEEECEAELLELLADATRIRLRADVPVGAYLSGGLDSSVITAMITRVSDAPLKTFSITFDDAEFDESGYQREVVRALQTAHQDVHCTYADICRAFPRVIWHTEKPVVRTAPVPLYLLSGLVRSHGYKVVLTGEGADELLGGYDIFKEAKIRRFCAVDPESNFRPHLLRRLYPYLPNLRAQSTAYLKATFRVGPDDLASPFFSHLPRWQITAQCKILFSDRVKSEIRGYSCYDELRQLLPACFSAWEPFCQAQYLETRFLLPGYILSSQGDRMAMGHSVEGRFPFLDYRVAEFAGTLPPRFKMKGLDEKHILKRAAGGLVPAAVRNRSKQPYRAPDAKSFFDESARAPRQPYVRDALSRARIEAHGLFDPSAVEKLVDKAASGRAVGFKDNVALVGVLSTQLLFDQYIDNNKPEGPQDADCGA